MINTQAIRPKFGWMSDGGHLINGKLEPQASAELTSELMDVSTLFNGKQSIDTLLPWVQSYALQSTLREDTREERTRTIKHLLKTSDNLPPAFRKRLSLYA